MDAYTLCMITDIMNQLGGRKFTAMVGAYNHVAIENGLQFSFRGSTKANKCRVTVSPSDTYTMEFFKIGGGYVRKVAEFENIYCDNLQAVFTQTTGLDCTL